ncbi:MAG: hypothetical protein DI533_21690 [Cereibacter sphaeroides]|uniref:Uncharacterized protein n=1 Tax=Cereibacter sphaeroides TaxID=1063 RepID=A0A2W5TG88_CERSP|nr:MAG: hypothetical protein DI533_21690 [Cereibacter sphaeroides]
MLKCVALIVGLITASSAYAGAWSYEERFRDPKTTEMGPAASATNAEGYTITISRPKDRRAYITLKLPDNSFDRLKLTGRIAAVRPDEKAVVFLETPPPMSGLETPFALPSLVRERIWHGQEEAPLTGTLRNILDSSKLTVRFFTDTGTTVDTVFDMAGAAPVIAKALGIPLKQDPVAAENAMMSRKLYAEAAMRCYGPSAKGTDSNACMAAVAQCSQKNEATFDAAAFRGCLGKSKWHADWAP